MNQTEPAITFRTPSPDRTYAMLYGGVCMFMLMIGLWIFMDGGDILPLILLPGIALLIVLPLIVRAFYPVIIVTAINVYVKQFFKLYKGDIKNITKVRKGQTIWSGFYKFGYRSGASQCFVNIKTTFISRRKMGVFLLRRC